MIALAALATAGMTVPATSGAKSKRTKVCKISGSKAQRLGTTYVTYRSGRAGYRVRRVSCRGGAKVIKSFHRCRLREGGRTGRCKTRVRGFRCSDRRPSRDRLVIGGDLQQFSGRVSCKRGSRRVIHIYQQAT